MPRVSTEARPDHLPGVSIRVAVEHGYDGGRVAAWGVDLPGCFAWGPDRAIALARVPSAVGRFADWLARHGERIDVPPSDRIEVVEELNAPLPAPGARASRGSRGSLLAADRRRATPTDVETTVRRMGYARADLLALVDRVHAWERLHGSLPAGDGADRDGLGVDEVLRHLGDSEVWLIGRLDRSARDDVPPKDGDLAAYLARTRSWAIERLRPLLAADDGTPVGAEASWTLPKVLRRLVYHGLDHLSELDRRLAIAERAADRLTYRQDRLVRPDEVAPLFRSVGWYRLIRDPARLARLLEGSTRIVTAWDADELVGFARAISDGAAYGLISTVAVQPRWQGRGVGRRLVTMLLDGNDGIRFSLSAVPGAESLYASAGFVPEHGAMVRRRLV